MLIVNRFLFITLLLSIYHYRPARAGVVVRREVKTDSEITTLSPSPATVTAATNITIITTTHRIPESINPDQKQQKVPNLVPSPIDEDANSDSADDGRVTSTEINDDSTQNDLSGYSFPQNDDDVVRMENNLHHNGGSEIDTNGDKTEAPDTNSAKEDEEDIGVRENVTEDFRFDISKYMTNASSPLSSITTTTVSSKYFEATTLIDELPRQHQTTTLDMEKQFDDLKLTTPQTPYFDEKHKQYKNDASALDDDDDTGDNRREEVDHTTRGIGDGGDNEFLSSNIETTTTEFASFDPTTLVSDTDVDEMTNNSTETKNSTYFTNVSVVEQTNYNINSNEVHQSSKGLAPPVTAPTSSMSGTKQKKGKYLNEFNESSTTFDLDAVTENSNSLNDSSDNDDLSSASAVAALKHVEYLSQQSGQAVNITTRSQSDESDDDIASENNFDDITQVKTIADWASIMENSEYTSDGAQVGDVSTTTESNSLDMDADVVENKVIPLTAIPPYAENDNRPLDDVSLDGDNDSDQMSGLTTINPPIKNMDSVTSIPTSVEVLSSTNDYDELSTVGPHMDDDENDESEIESDDDITTTENNFIVRDSEEKIKSTTSIVASTSRVTISRGGTTIVPLVAQPETTPATTTTTTTETIRIEILNPLASASTVNYEKDIVDITTYTEKNAKVDTSLDSSNSIERVTEIINPVNNTTAAPSTETNDHEVNSLPVDTNRENLKYNTVSETTQKPIVEISAPTESTNRTPQLHADTATLPSKQNFDENLLFPKASEDEGMDVNVIIAISVCTVGLVALILLVGFLVLMRKRQKNLTYGQRCRPVGLDAYSLDNVSVYNSVRRKNNLRLSKRSYGNSAFEDPALKNNVLKIGDLATFIQNQNTIFEEFKDIPMVTARVDEVPAGCEAKNRYANVVPLPETRVHLKRLNDDEKTEYINANYVKGPKDPSHYYIACQAPLENTISDFWRMIWEQNSKVIIMATDLNENGIEKCADYLPPSIVLDCNRQFDDYQVTLKNREVKEKYAVSTVHLKNIKTNTWREITHFWYQWPDTGVPTDEASIIAMLLEARSYLKMSTPEQSDESNADGVEANGIADSTTNGIDKTRSLQLGQGPITVHCSPGTGRTGTIIACDIAIRALELPTRSVDIPQLVYYVRRGRASSVRTREQYEFIYKVANMYGTKLTGPTAEN